jgi:hypothetical protein
MLLITLSQFEPHTHTVHWVDEDIASLPSHGQEVLIVMFNDMDNEGYRDHYIQQWLQQYPCVVYMTLEGQINVVTR